MAKKNKEAYPEFYRYFTATFKYYIVLCKNILLKIEEHQFKKVKVLNYRHIFTHYKEMLPTK